MKRILIGIYNDIYDVSNYINKHPGEGIKDTYLYSFKMTEASKDFDRHHMTNEPDDILINAKQNGLDEESGIYYVCPYFFKSKRIPNYFHFYPNDLYCSEYMEDKKDNTFILRRSNSDTLNSLSLTYKLNNNINHLKIRKIDNKWYTIWENEDGEPEDIYTNTIKEMIKKIMIENDFTPLF